MSKSSSQSVDFRKAAASSLESFVSTTLQGESEAVLNKLARGEHLYNYAWFSCREDADFAKSNWDKHVSAALAVARAKRELSDSNAKRWIYWFALHSVGGADLVKLSCQSVPCLRSLERLVEFIGLDEPGEGESFPDAPADGPTFQLIDGKAASVLDRILNRKNPATGDQAAEAVNKTFPGRIKSRGKSADDAETAETAETAEAPSKSAAPADGAVDLQSLTPGGLASLVRSYLASVDDDTKRTAILAVTNVLKDFAKGGQAAAAKPSAGVGAVAPAALAAAASA